MRSVQVTRILSAADKEEREERDEDSGDRLLGTGWYSADKGFGLSWAYRVPLGSAAERRRWGRERRLRCGLESGKRRIRRRGRWRRCSRKPGRRIDRRRALDRGAESATALQPSRYDRRAGERARENECPAKRSCVGIRNWDLRPPRRRNIDRGEQARDGFSGARSAGVGSGSDEGRGAANSRGARTLWDYFGARRWCTVKDDAAIQDRGRGKT